MGKALPLFDEYLPSRAAVEADSALDRSQLEDVNKGKACVRCALGRIEEHVEEGEPSTFHSKLRAPCMQAFGQPGGLLVVGDAPSKDDDQMAQPFAGATGRFLRQQIVAHWSGPVAYDFGLRCFPGMTKTTEKHVTACRGFLRSTIEEVKPTRVLAVGGLAALGLFGRTVPPMTSRGAYAWLRNEGNPVPVFFALPPLAALRNRFVRKWFEADIKHALTRPVPARPPWDAEAVLVTNARLAQLAERALMRSAWVAFDVETYGKMWDEEFRIMAVAMCGSREDDAWVWPEETLHLLNRTTVDLLRAADGRLSEQMFAQVEREAGTPLAVLLRLLTSTRLAKVGQNVKYDQLAFRARYGITVRPITVDTRLQRKLLEPEADGGLAKMAELVGLGGHKEEAQEAMDGLKASVKRAFGKKTPELQNEAVAKLGLSPEIEAALRLGASVESYAFALLPKDLLYKYNARDALVTKHLAVKLPEELRAVPELQKVWDRQVLPAAVALERVEGWGIAVSKDAMQVFDSYLSTRASSCSRVLDQYGAGVNWDSRDQVADLLYTKLRLPVGKQTPTGKPSTDEETLDHLTKMTGHPLPAALVDYRFVTKLRGTYARGMFPHIREDGRIHCNFKLSGARSGRLSVTDPALQTIPRAQTVEGKMLRDCFVARPGYVLIEADYSQLELRIAAMLSGDKVMQGIFSSGVDYHLATAKLVCKIAWGVSDWDALSDADKDKYRSIAKTVNFGVLYGKTAVTFAKEWSISKHKAQTIVDAIMGSFKDLQRWCAAREAEAMKTGEVWTQWMGERARRRPLWQIADPDDGRASVAKNGAKNCLDAETEALTQRGWVKGLDLRRDDVLLTKSPVTGALEWQRMIDLKLWPDYEGPLVEFKSKSFHAVSTPDHRWLTRDKSSGLDVERTTRTLSPWGDHRIHRTGEYRPAVSSGLTPDEAELLGWFVTDGPLRPPRGIGKRKDQRRGYRAFVHQSYLDNPDKCERISALVSRLDLKGESKLHKGKAYTWSLGLTISTWLQKRCPSRTLTIEAMIDLDRAALDRLREAMLLGDGTCDATGKQVLATGRKEQAEAFQILCTLTGAHASIACRDMSKYAPKSRHLSNVPKMGVVWLATVLRRDTTQVTHQQRREVTVKAPIWCPVVPNTFFVARRSGTVYITGNSPVQGTAADYATASLAQCVQWIEEDGIEQDVKLVLSVHDSLMFEVRESWVSEVAGTVNQIMLSHDSGGVPLVADFKRGPAWGSMSKLEVK